MAAWHGVTDWEQGSIDSSGNVQSSTRIRTSGSLSLDGISAFAVRAFSTGSKAIQIDYVGLDAHGAKVDDVYWCDSGSVFVPVSTAVTARFVLRFSDNSAITPSDLQSCDWDTSATAPWQTQEDVNDGYPINTDNPTMPMDTLSAPYPHNIMRIDGVTNDGYPYLWWMRDEQEPDIGVNLLYMCGQQPQRLYYGTAEVQGCYYGGQLVYRPPSQL